MPSSCSRCAATSEVPVIDSRWLRKLSMTPIALADDVPTSAVAWVSAWRAWVTSATPLSEERVSAAELCSNAAARPLICAPAFSEAAVMSLDRWRSASPAAPMRSTLWLAIFASASARSLSALPTPPI